MPKSYNLPTAVVPIPGAVSPGCDLIGKAALFFGWLLVAAVPRAGVCTALI